MFCYQDNSGEISAEELKEFFVLHDCEINDNIWIKLIKEVDEDGNGEISYEEFKKMMFKLI